MSVDPTLVAFGRRLRGERLGLQLSQVEFAKLGGVTENSQTAYEKGKTPPTVAYLYRLAEHRVDIGYVLTGQHSDGGHSAEQAILFELFGRLSAREREAVMALLMTLAGQTASLAEIGAQAKAARLQLPEMGQTLQDRRSDFRAEGDDQ